jgi:murein DD-endopeptidase MepM/ murein hydrolase activator NlpD
MSEDKKVYTFLLFSPTGSSKVRQISFHHNLLYILGGSLLIVLLFGVIAIVRLAQNESLSFRYFSTKAENEKLKRENESYQSSYARLKGQIDYIGDMSKEIARQANLEPGRDLDLQVGTGGPETVTALASASSQLELRLRSIGDVIRSNQLRLATIPTGMPVSGYLTDDFGVRNNPFSGEGFESHQGLDLAAEFGTPVQATADGIIIMAESHSGYGNLVAIYHSDGITTRYGHLSKIGVEVGQRVRRGDQIGNVGSTGRSTGPHVHYEVRENDQPVDPQRYIGRSNL